MREKIPVNKIGKIKISHMEVLFAAWIDEIPRMVTSDDVSKPKLNMTPSGYIFQGLSQR